MEKYQSWDLVRDSGNNVTLESISRNIINIPKDLIEEISNNGALDIEIQNYEQKEKELEQRVQDVLDADGPTSRRNYISWVTPPDQNHHCISLIQLLSRDNHSVLNIYQRSSSTDKLPSDLGFFCRLGKKYNVDEIQVFIGSFHTYITKTWESEGNTETHANIFDR